MFLINSIRVVFNLIYLTLLIYESYFHISLKIYKLFKSNL